MFFSTSRIALQQTHQYNVPALADIPGVFCCPISRELMVDPVVLHGIIYERSCIEEWVQRNGTDVYHTPAEMKMIEACADLRAVVVQFAAMNNYQLVAVV